jgi:HEAT repeat protein
MRTLMLLALTTLLCTACADEPAKDAMPAEPTWLTARPANVEDETTILASLQATASRTERLSVTYKLLRLSETLGGRLRAAIPFLCQGLDDSNPCVRAISARALASIGDYGLEVKGPLLRCATDDDAVLRACAMGAIGMAGQVDADMISALRRGLSDESGYVREEAAIALGNLGARADSAVPGLMDALEGACPSLRAELIRALGSIGLGSSELSSVVGSCLREDSSWRVRAAAAHAIGAARDNKWIASILVSDGLRDCDPVVRAESCEAIGRLGRAPENVRAQLARLAGDVTEYAWVRYAAQSATESIELPSR